MPTFQKAIGELPELAVELLERYDTHHPIRDARVKIDLIWAYGDRDDDDNLISDALKKNGIRAYGLAKVLSLKDRVMGRGDCEILIDHDFWETASEETHAALLDHELVHIQLKLDKTGAVIADDIGRPKLKLRKHSYEIGWFSEVAARHGVHSIERQQAKQMMDESGQIYWPSLMASQQQLGGSVTIKAGDKEVTMTHQRFSNIAKSIEQKARAK